MWRRFAFDSYKILPLPNFISETISPALELTYPLLILTFLLLRRRRRTQRSNPMGSLGDLNNSVNSRKPRFLCLHGFRTSGEILRKQIHTKWPESILDKLDLVFVDAPYPSQGKSDVEGIFDPPYYEWFQFNKVYQIHSLRCLIFLSI